MQRHVVVDKHVGETPLQALQRFRAQRIDLADVPLAYAGRLDPMASGALLVLIGDACKQQDRYTRLDKEYQFEVLLGVQSDTGDVLGLIDTCAAPGAVSTESVQCVAHALRGAHTWAYPVFSSKPVNGKPLFMHMHDGTIGDIELPQTQVRIHHLRYDGATAVSREALVQRVIERIEQLHVDEHPAYPGSDFRRSEIVARWQAHRSSMAAAYPVLRFSATASAGTYIRTLAPLIAERLGSCGLAASIHRTRIGRFQPLGRGRGFWWPSSFAVPAAHSRGVLEGQ